MIDSSFTPFAKKSLGQHWLQDAAALQAMVDAAQLQPGDHVVEIGPGYGTLTARLLEAGAQVTALELDETLIPNLRQKFAAAGEQLHIVEADIRRYNFTQLAPDYKIVANIPYYLTSNLIQLLSESANPPLTAVLLMQKEVAERVVAAPGDMSLLSVTAQFYWQCSLGRVVDAKLFSPPPKVQSQILILERRPTPLLPRAEAADFFRLVRAGFSQKRKTLLNSLSGGLGISREVAAARLAQADIDSQRRAQTLSLEEWQRLHGGH